MKSVTIFVETNSLYNGIRYHNVEITNIERVTKYGREFIKATFIPNGIPGIIIKLKYDYFSQQNVIHMYRYDGKQWKMRIGYKTDLFEQLKYGFTPSIAESIWKKIGA